MATPNEAYVAERCWHGFWVAIFERARRTLDGCASKSI